MDAGMLDGVLFVNISNIAAFCAHNQHGKLQVSESTFKHSYKATQARLLDFFGDISVANIEPIELIDWQDWLNDRCKSVATRNSYVRTARSFWNQLRRRGVPVCDTTDVFSIRRESKGVKSITTDNAYKMLAFSGIRNTAILWLAMDSGRRRGGLVNLKIEDVKIIYDEEDQEFRVIGHVREKGDKPQLLLAGHEAAMALQLWLHLREKLMKILRVYDDGYVFVNLKTGKQLTPETFTDIAKRIKHAAQIPGDVSANLHAFRHRWAKEAIKKYKDIPFVRDILGHASAQTTLDIYAVNGEEELIDQFFDKRKKNGD